MKIFIDVETTGFNPFRDSVIELGSIITDDKGIEIARFNQLCRPDPIGNGRFNWNKKAEETHGISYETAVKSQHPINLCVNYLNFLAEHVMRPLPLSMFTKNMAFDLRMLTGLMHKNLEHHYFGMYKFIKHNEWENIAAFMPDGLADNAKLETIAKKLKIPHNAHRAIGDCEVTVELFKRYGVTNE